MPRWSSPRLRLALGVVVAAACLTVPAQAALLAPGADPLPDLAADVDPRVGTFAPGFTVPGATVPFGMVQVSPDTGGPVAYSGYSWHDPRIQGFSHVHLSGPGVKKAGDVPLMPTVGQVTSSDPQRYASPYDHATERATAGAYGVRLGNGVQVDVGATTRTGVQRYGFPAGQQGNVLLDVARSVEGVHTGSLEVVDADTVRGSARGRYGVFFEADFSRPFTATGTWLGGTLTPGGRDVSGPGAGGWVSFAGGGEVTVTVGISFVDAAGARRNLDAEARRDLPTTQAAAREAWNAELGRVRVEGGTPLDTRTFRTALYHSLLHPNVFSDVDGRYTGFDGAVHDAGARVQYANFSSWDTYKSQNQLLATVWPERYRDMLLSLLADAREGGPLPRWGEQTLDAGHMSGDPVVPMVVDGWCRGVLDDVAPELVDELVAEMRELRERREAAWQDKGYLPLQTSSRGAGTTLEYGVADFALALMQHSRGEDASAALEGATAYRQLLDPETRWVRPRNDDGSFLTPFDPALDETGFQEGNSWQYSWLAPHDARGLFDRMGGDAAAVERLDTHFSEPVARAVPVAVAEAQSKATLFGLVYRTNQYAPGNEHDLQTSWMYAHAGQPAKVQSVQRQLQGAFRPTIDGLPGNDDLGGLSAWYVMSALGLGPVTPGAPLYVVGSPVFERAVLDVPGPGDIVVEAPGASLTGKFVQSATLDGAPLDRAWVRHDELGGRVLRLQMGPAESAWGTGSRPPSLSDAASPDDALAAFGCASR